MYITGTISNNIFTYHSYVLVGSGSSLLFISTCGVDPLQVGGETFVLILFGRLHDIGRFVDATPYYDDVTAQLTNGLHVSTHVIT